MSSIKERSVDLSNTAKHRIAEAVGVVVDIGGGEDDRLAVSLVPLGRIHVTCLTNICYNFDKYM